MARRKERNEQAVADLAKDGLKATSIELDVADERAVSEAMAQVADQFGRLDSCFANAAVPSGGMGLLDMSLGEFRRVTAVDLDGAFVTLREAARHMIELGNGGRLSATSSMAALLAGGRNYAYAASKAGVIAMIRSMARELAPHDIRATTILPGWTESEMTASMLTAPGFADRVMPRQLVNRWGTPADFAGVAVYLASDASTYVTGDVIRLDGGFVVA